MLNASRGCRVRTTVVIDEIAVESAFNESMCRGGGGILSSASRVLVAGRVAVGTRVRGQRRWCPSRLLPQRCKTRRIDELILGMSCVSMLHVGCRDFCALIIDAERLRRRLSCFCKVSGVGVPSICRGNGLHPSRGWLSLPQRPSVYCRASRATSASPKRAPRDPPNSNALQVGSPSSPTSQNAYEIIRSRRLWYSFPWNFPSTMKQKEQ